MRWGTLLCACIFAAALSGCVTDGSGVIPPPISETPPATLTVQDPTDVKYYPSDEPLKLALEHFNRGHFGIAAQYFEDAVSKAPEDATAWVGLAASYDRIGRFDLADRAYKQAIRLEGETTAILNNQGYSYMLRGRLPEARRRLLKAYEREPNNPTVLNNLKLLNSSQKYIKRDDGS
ncbi:MAG TPA: tetratricopeptide repeat protein [Patescibacteria group bacterium]|jgi:Flp pilus assembly protein TadD|nr:tetratricopeptide repeat protein [Patescibacteria group bacterium]